MTEWIRFFFTAVLLSAGLCCFLAAVTGNLRFGFVMNRMHSAGIGDTVGLLCVTAAMILVSGFRLSSLKLVLVLVFLWIASPVSTHFLSQVEYYNNKDLRDHMRMPDEEDSETGD